MRQQLTAIRIALLRNRAARNRDQAARARHDMRSWQVERRKRTRHLIELGGLVVKAGIVNVTGDDRAIILGALLWMADKLHSDQGQRARELWAAMGILLDESDLPQSIESLGYVERTADPEQAANFGGGSPGVVVQFEYLLIERVIVARPR